MGDAKLPPPPRPRPRLTLFIESWLDRTPIPNNWPFLIVGLPWFIGTLIALILLFLQQFSAAALVFFVACVVGAGAWAIRRQRQARTLLIRRIAGRCLVCGYDLRASPKRCPECGHDRHNPVADGVIP